MPHGLPPAQMGGQGGNERISRAASLAMRPVTATITGGGLHSHRSTPHVRGPRSSALCTSVGQILTFEQHTSWYLYQISF
jgi:hypothetical protein